MLLAAVAVVTSAVPARAFDNDKYATNSVLANGTWVKISVPESGLYSISRSQLHQWGFSDPAKVRVYGYGGERIPDLLSSANYIDDLPMVPTTVTSSGNVVFYGVGPESWSTTITSRFSRTSNIYTTAGYYFVTEAAADAPADEIETSGRPSATSPVKVFWNRLHHELDLTSPGKAGPQLVGEEFRLTSKRDFKFDLTDRDDTNDPGIWFETSFVTKTYDQASTLRFTANGQSVPEVSTDRISSTTSDSHYYGTEGVTRHTLYDVEGATLTLGLSLSSPVTVQNAWLNYITVNYQRKLQLDNEGKLMFWSNNPSLSLGNATTTTRVFDVTTPLNISEVNISDLTADGRREWSASYSGWRTYVAFDDNAKLPEPHFVGHVSNQDLHSTAETGVPDMVIVCPATMTAQAQRIARLHAADEFEPLEVQIVEPEKIYNEFSSGMADVAGLRKYFKFLWDKGKNEAPDGYESKFRYVILIGRTTYDPRMLTAEVKNFLPFSIPTWMGANMRQSLNDTDGYGTDDVLSFLKDNSGNDKGLDDLCIAIGRIPVRSVAELSNYIDKLEQYVTASKKATWKNTVMFLADDADGGKHMDQAESFSKNMESIADNPLLVKKVYIDAYEREGSRYPEARKAMFNALNEGVVWWSYIGHANERSLTHNEILTLNDLQQMYYKNVPVFYGATCDFLRWDDNTLSGGEIMLNERYGGAITVISATRPVYIYENGLLSNAFGRHVGARDAQGRLLTVGEIYRRAKNNILTGTIKTSNTNRLKYVFMGDPAMRLATPSNIVEFTEVAGRDIVGSGNNDPVELHALQTVPVKGCIRGYDGQLLNDFNGTVTVTLYDAEFSTTTHGNKDNGTEGKAVTFEQQGPRLSVAMAQVKNGEFEATLTIPVDISDNYRPAMLGGYAYADNNKGEAAGKNRNVYVYGFDETADVDANPPVIESMYLNHVSFNEGGTTDSSPMLIAKITDDTAISLSTAGIGHTMVIQLDGNKTYTDVANYYTPMADGTPGGTINYPLSNLPTGEHTLVLKVWDASANSASKTINFKVGERIAPKIYDIYTDASPAHDKANFYIVHDRPEQMATVTVEVFNLLGHQLWSRTMTGISDMFTSSPVTWDLTDMAGRRVQRGIYLYRATITVDGQTHDTGSRRIAVAAQ